MIPNNMIPNSMTRAQVRDVDRQAIEEFGLPGIVLMENAGRGCVELLRSLGIDGKVVVCAGKGNNAGDGFVIARHLHNVGIPVEIVLFCRSDELGGDAAINFHVIQKMELSIQEWNSTQELQALLQPADWIIDALLGTGTQGSIREPFASAIQCINQSGRKVMSVDLPSGMDCDIGSPIPPEQSNESTVAACCVRAAHTATFVARKIGFDQPHSAEFTGQVHVIDIGAPRSILESIHHEG